MLKSHTVPPGIVFVCLSCFSIIDASNKRSLVIHDLDPAETNDENWSKSNIGGDSLCQRGLLNYPFPPRLHTEGVDTGEVSKFSDSK